MNTNPNPAGAEQAPATISYEYGVLEPNGEVRVMPEAAARDRVRIAHPSWGMKVVRRVVITGEWVWVEDGPTTAVSAGIPHLVDRISAALESEDPANAVADVARQWVVSTVAAHTRQLRRELEETRAALDLARRRAVGLLWEVAELERQRAAVLELHKPVDLGFYGQKSCLECLGEDDGKAHPIEWPCPTVRALGAGEEPEGSEA